MRVFFGEFLRLRVTRVSRQKNDRPPRVTAVRIVSIIISASIIRHSLREFCTVEFQDGRGGGLR